MSSIQAYQPSHPAESRFLMARGLKHHVLVWGDLSLATPAQPLLVLLHGWMDTAASFQFMVDALRQQSGWSTRPIVAIDWRGFGLTDTPQADGYFFADYLGDLDMLLDQLAPEGQKVDLLGHSMGGNVVMLYAGVRSERIRKLVNLEARLVADPLPAVRGDRDRLRQLLLNLLTNAAKYTVAGDEINVRAAAEDGSVMVSVEDHGPGIAPEEQRLVFEKFGRVNSGGRSKPGAGLGLFIARSIAEAHGGSLDVRSEPGAGATFTFRLPSASSA